MANKYLYDFNRDKKEGADNDSSLSDESGDGLQSERIGTA
jgi:hypothetical protein